MAKQVEPNILLIGLTDNGRELGPRLAFRLQTGLASDCVGLEINPETKLMEAARPVSGGNAMAVVVVKKTRPQMATVRPKTMPQAPMLINTDVNVIRRQQVNHFLGKLKIVQLGFIHAYDTVANTALAVKQE